MTTPVPLSAEAEGCRRALADWITRAQMQNDFVLDEKGNRIYLREKIKPLVEPLLQAMGLVVGLLPIKGHY